ncbi:hypothetical protein HHI36_014965 [Cryptolaemus montrouzieri]|uniref:Uncharacterized protein n=1 Tax=Cryptolaemus montrouzieri TaxID=559131 RepID=A0ABD2N450_9CUCU
MEKTVKGLEVTRIYPLNPHIFDDEDILTADPIVEAASRQISQSGPTTVTINFRLAQRNYVSYSLGQADQNSFDMFAEETAYSIPLTANYNAEKNVVEKNVEEKKQATGKSAKRNSSEGSGDEDNIKNKTKKVRQGKKKGKLMSKKCMDSSSEDSMDDVPLTQLCIDDEDDDIENRDICAVWS